MQKKQIPIPLLFHRCTVILLYLCFFAVQFSANYNYATQYSRGSSSENYSAKHSNQLQAISKTEKGEGKKLHIRLNKRFAPSSALHCEVFVSVKTNNYTIVKKEAAIYVAPYIPSSHLQVKALRGPPIIVT